jgi:hypothetical protein
MAIEQVGPGGVGNSYGQRTTTTPTLMDEAGVRKDLYQEYGSSTIPSNYGTVTASTSAGQTLKSGPGYLKSFTVIAKGTSPTLQVWDNTTASGTVLVPQLNGTTAVGDFPALNIGETYVWDEPLFFSNGAHIVIGGTGTTTIQFQVK